MPVDTDARCSTGTRAGQTRTGRPQVRDTADGEQHVGLPLQRIPGDRCSGHERSSWTSTRSAGFDIGVLIGVSVTVLSPAATGCSEPGMIVGHGADCAQGDWQRGDHRRFRAGR